MKDGNSSDSVLALALVSPRSRSHEDSVVREHLRATIKRSAQLRIELASVRADAESVRQKAKDVLTRSRTLLEHRVQVDWTTASFAQCSDVGASSFIRIKKVDQFRQGLVVEFQDGSAAFIKAATLYQMMVARKLQLPEEDITEVLSVKTQKNSQKTTRRKVLSFPVTR